MIIAITRSVREVEGNKIDAAITLVSETAVVADGNPNRAIAGEESRNESAIAKIDRKGGEGRIRVDPEKRVGMVLRSRGRKEPLGRAT